MVILSYVFFFTVAGTCAWLVEKTSPGGTPGGAITTTILGTIGACVGSYYLNRFGPKFYGVSMLPGILCAILVVIAVSYIWREYKRNQSQ